MIDRLPRQPPLSSLAGITVSEDGRVWAIQKHPFLVHEPSDEVLTFHPDRPLDERRRTIGSSATDLAVGVAAAPDGSVALARRLREPTPGGGSIDAAVVEFLDPELNVVSGFNPGVLPKAVAVGPDGDVYLAAIGHHEVLRFTSEGDLVATYGAPREPGTVDLSPTHVAVGPDGTVAVLLPTQQNFPAVRVAVFAADGTPRAEFAPPAHDPFIALTGIAVTPSRLVIADDGASRIRVFDHDGTEVGDFAGFGASGSHEAQSFLLRGGLALGPTGHIYVGDSATRGGRIQVYSSEGNFVEQYGPGGLAVEPFHVGSLTAHDDEVFVADRVWGAVLRLRADGAYLGTLTVPAEVGEMAFRAADLAATDAGLYIADKRTRQVVHLARDGRLVRTFGSPGEGPGELGSSPLAMEVAVTADGGVVVGVEGKLAVFGADGAHHFDVALPPRPRGGVIAPADLAVGPDGSIYVVDLLGSYVLRMSLDGTVLGFLGETDGPMGFEGTKGVAVDAEGLVHVTRNDRHQVEVYQPDGTLVRRWGRPGGRDGEFLTPLDIAITGDRVFVADQQHPGLQVFAPDGIFQGTLTHGGTGEPRLHARSLHFAPTGERFVNRGFGAPNQGSISGTFQLDEHGRLLGAVRDIAARPLLRNPADVAVGAGGEIYVADRGNSRVKVHRHSGAVTDVWDIPHLGRRIRPLALAAAGGRVYVTDQESGRVLTLDDGGRLLAEWGSATADDGTFPIPIGVAVGADGTIHVADFVLRRVERFTPSGDFLGAIEIPDTVGNSLNLPDGIAVVGDGTIFVSVRSGQVLRFTSDGELLSDWRSPTGSRPGHLTVTPEGTLLTGAGSAVEELTFDGALVRRWGQGRFGNAVAARLDHDGTVLVADLTQDRIRRFTRTGALLDQWGQSSSGLPGENVARGVLEPLLGFGSLASGSIAVDEHGNRFVSPPASDTCTSHPAPIISKVDALGGLVFSFAPRGNGNGQFCGGSLLAAPGGLLYATDRNGTSVFTSAGEFVRKLPIPAGPKAVTGDGTILVGDPATSTVLQFTPTGSPLPSLPAPIPPRLLALGPSGDIYLGDQFTTLARMRPDGQVLTVWEDEGGPKAEMLSLAVDQRERLHVVDVNERVVRVYGHATEDTSPPHTRVEEDPVPTMDGWVGGSRARVTLSAVDQGTGVAAATGTSQVNVDIEGIPQPCPQGPICTVEITNPGITRLMYWAQDHAGNHEHVRGAVVQFDPDPPNVGALRVDAVVRVDDVVVVEADAADSLSGVAGGEWFIGADPGPGAGSPMRFSAGALHGEVTGVPAGVHTLSVRSVDRAGNWSEPEAVEFVVVDPNAGPLRAAGFYTAPSGTWPESGRDSRAVVSLDVRYEPAGDRPTGRFLVTGNDLRFAATEFDWFVVDAESISVAGAGILDGAGGLGFRLGLATKPERVRLTLRDLDSGRVVYDTAPGSGIHDPPDLRFRGTVSTR